MHLCFTCHALPLSSIRTDHVTIEHVPNRVYACYRAYHSHVRVVRKQHHLFKLPATREKRQHTFLSCYPLPPSLPKFVCACFSNLSTLLVSSYDLSPHDLLFLSTCVCPSVSLVPLLFLLTLCPLTQLLLTFLYSSPAPVRSQDYQSICLVPIHVNRKRKTQTRTLECTTCVNALIHEVDLLVFQNISSA